MCFDLRSFFVFDIIFEVVACISLSKIIGALYAQVRALSLISEALAESSGLLSHHSE